MRLLRRLAAMEWQRLVRGVVEYNVISRFRPLPPKVMTAVVTYRCDSRCAMCAIWRTPRGPELTVDEFGRVVEDPLFDAIEQLTLTGGEPTLRDDLVDLTGRLVERMTGLRSLSLVSNGFRAGRVLAATEAMLAMCRPRGIGFNVSISLDGLGSDHDQVRGVTGSFEKVLVTLEGLMALRAANEFWMGVGYTLMRGNVAAVRGFRRWAAVRGLDVGFVPVGFHGSYVANLDVQDDVDFRPEDMDVLIELMQELGTRRSLFDPRAYFWNDMVGVYRDGADRTTPCPYNIDGLALDCCGDVFYCLSMPSIGNCLQGRSVGEIYHDPANLDYRATTMRADACRRCTSGCAVSYALKKDLTKYLRFLLSR